MDDGWIILKHFETFFENLEIREQFHHHQSTRIVSLSPINSRSDFINADQFVNAVINTDQYMLLYNINYIHTQFYTTISVFHKFELFESRVRIGKPGRKRGKRTKLGDPGNRLWNIHWERVHWSIVTDDMWSNMWYVMICDQYVSCHVPSYLMLLHGFCRRLSV